MASHDRPVTIYTVAAAAGVSIATVSRVLQGSTPSSPETRAKVLRAVRELGYVPLRAGRNSALRLEAHGLVMAALGGPYYSDLLAGYETTTEQFGQSVSVLSAERPTPTDLEHRVLDLALKVDGMVLASATVSDEVAMAVAQRVPTVLVARSPLPGCDTVVVENHDSTQALVGHLLGHGLSRLLFVGDPTQAEDVAQRYQGFLDGLAGAGLAEVAAPIPVGFVEAAATTAAEALPAPGKVQALVCANDELALGLWRVMRQRGVRVPDDLVITGWDDVMAAHYTGLTTVRQPAREVGRIAATRLHERIVGSHPHRGLVVVASELVIRSSCGCREPPW